MPVLPTLAAAGVLGAPLLAATLFLASSDISPPTGLPCTLQLPADPRQAPREAGRPAANETIVEANGELESGGGNVVLLAEQVATARAVVATAKDLRLSERAAAAALAVLWQRDALLRPDKSALRGEPRPAQRSMAVQPTEPTGWSAAHGAAAAGHGAALASLLRQVAGVQNWQTRPVAEIALALHASHPTSRSDTASSARAETAAYAGGATALAHALWQPDHAALRCQPSAGGSPNGAPAGPLPQACTVRPDPTTGRGCLTPRTALLATALLAAGWPVSCWDPHLWNPSSDHPHGRACDVTIGRAGRYPQAPERARGDALARALQAGAGHSGVDYVIWSGRIWSAARAHEGWRPYAGGGVYDPHSPTGGHYDHIHISVS